MPQLFDFIIILAEITMSITLPVTFSVTLHQNQIVYSKSKSKFKKFGTFLDEAFTRPH